MLFEMAPAVGGLSARASWLGTGCPEHFGPHQFCGLRFGCLNLDNFIAYSDFISCYDVVFGNVVKSLMFTSLVPMMFPYVFLMNSDIWDYDMFIGKRFAQ